MFSTFVNSSGCVDRTFSNMKPATTPSNGTVAHVIINWHEHYNNTGIAKSARTNVLRRINDLLREILQVCGKTCRNQTIEDSLVTGLASVLEIYTTILTEASDESLNPKLAADKTKIRAIYTCKALMIHNELKSLKPGENGLKAPHTDDFLRSVERWHHKAHGTAASTAMNSSPASLAQAPAASRYVAAPMKIIYTPPTNSNVVRSPSSFGSAMPAPYLAPAPSSVPVSVYNGNVDKSIGIASTPPAYNNTAGSAPPTGSETAHEPRPFPSPSPELLPVPDVFRQVGLEFLITELKKGNKLAAKKYEERLTALEIPECATMMECDVLQQMLQEMRRKNIRTTQHDIESVYCKRVEAEGFACRILKRLVKKVQRFHVKLKGLARRAKDRVKSVFKKSKDGDIVISDDDGSVYQEALSPLPPTPSMENLREEFKNELYRVLVETGQRLLSCENLPQLNITQNQLEDLTIQLEALMFGHLKRITETCT
ncbi:hypothetical protein DE146DRAFT_759185 [Phaeosphaeria sp. MPI-PUGE-AT-0046c]|nr:hypothetical protein DE146DRAFT_759185 [Phaeosphaeria sp. MPI-PUGE-AT-0046c]